LQNEVAAKLELILTGRKGGPLLSLAQMRDRLSEAIKPAVALRRNFADEENKTHDGVTLMQDRGMNSEEGEITLASAASSALHRPDFRDHDHDHDHDDHRPLRRTRRNSNEDWDDAELDAWLRDGEDTDPALCCGGCCTLLAFLAALFCSISPYWIWQIGQVGVYSKITTSTGGYAVAAQTLSGRFANNKSFVRQWTYWNTLPDFEGYCSNKTILISGDYYSGSMYSDWAERYGFCDEVDGHFSTPATVIIIQVCSTCATIAALGATCFSCATPSSGVWAMRTAGVFSVIASGLAIASVALAVNFPWYKDLRDGSGFLPMRYVDIYTDAVGVIAVQQPPMSYGPAFVGMAITSIICLASGGLFLLTTQSRTAHYAANSSGFEDHTRLLRNKTSSANHGIELPTINTVSQV